MIKKITLLELENLVKIHPEQSNYLLAGGKIIATDSKKRPVGETREIGKVEVKGREFTLFLGGKMT